MSLRQIALLLTLEHASYFIPAQYCHLFKGQRQVLLSHRGYDAGSQELGDYFADYFKVRPFIFPLSRLLIEANRSTHHWQLFSEYSAKLDAKSKSTLLEKYYWPYRHSIIHSIEQALAQKRCVFHVALHSFTPKLKDEIRNNDIGLLYDPTRKAESQLCLYWQKYLNCHTAFKVRRNYPYRGYSDGLTRWLRKRYSQSQYLGIELETNQMLWQQEDKLQQLSRHSLAMSLQHSLEYLTSDSFTFS